MSRRKSKTPKKDSRASRKKDKYRTRNWKEYSAPQAHDQEVLIVPSCIEDEGRPFEVSFQVIHWEQGILGMTT